MSVPLVVLAAANSNGRDVLVLEIRVVGQDLVSLGASGQKVAHVLDAHPTRRRRPTPARGPCALASPGLRRHGPVQPGTPSGVLRRTRGPDRSRSDTWGCGIPRSLPACAWVTRRAFSALKICSIRPALSASCSGLGRPRSAKTLPATLLDVNPGLLRHVISASLGDDARLPPVAGARGRSPAAVPSRQGRLLLERVEHSQTESLNFHRVDGSIGVPIVRDDDLEHAAPAESVKGLDGSILLASLRSEERVADVELEPALEAHAARSARDERIQNTGLIGMSAPATLSIIP